MANGLLSAELAATCNALGYFDGEKYHLEPHSKETIKDLIRYLRRDEDTHDIRRFLGNTKLLQTDLLPILQCYAKDKELFDVVLRLIVNLITPALIIYNEVVPTDKSELNQYLQIISHLQIYKEAFSDQKTWAVITENLSNLLGKEVGERDEDDQRNIERILILVRNVLHVPANASSDWRPDNDASSHDQVIWALHQSGMLDLLLYMASSSKECTFFMHLLEIICLLIREQPPSLLAKTASQRSVDEKHRDEEELLRIRQKESIMKQSKTKKHFGSRHSNFGGTFIIKNLKSTSDSDLIYHKPLQKLTNFTLDNGKKPKKIPKNRLPLKCESVERISALSVRLILKQFCVEILNAAYNPLMKYVKDCLVRGSSQSNDESYYFTALKFFMEFNRIYKFHVKLVSETMSVETFYFVQKYLETWHEMMVTDKKKIPLWSARMHIALKAYKELLQNLVAMDSSSEEAVRESSKVIKSNVFYVVEYREMLLTLINTYKKSKYSHQYLIDLLETIHIFLKLLGHFCQNKKIMVQKQVSARRKKVKKIERKDVSTPDINGLWLSVKSDLEKFLTLPSTKEVIPFDATLNKDIEEQKVDAMKRIQVLLKSSRCEEAIALMKASREVWPENDYFGSKGISPEEELNCLKEVFFAELDVSDVPRLYETNDNDEISEEEEEDIYHHITEQSFDVKDLVKRFASPRVMSVCITLLSTFEENSAFTNHCITKMLHRIAWECKLPSMLFQASLFRRFQRIMESVDPAHKELVKLAKYIMQKFSEVAASNKKLLLELLFFKTAKDCYEIECGYGSFQEKSKSAKLIWEEHEEDELRRLHEEYMKIKPSENLVDWITDNIINKNRTSRSIKKKLKELGLLSEDKRKEWSEGQKEELKRLYEDFKATDDPVHNILEKLSENRSRRNIATTLVALGLVDSTKALRKKRTKQNVGKKPQVDSSDTDSSSSDDEETVDERRAKEPIPELIDTVSLIFKQKDSETYLGEGIKWVKACLTDCVEDIDDDPTEVPLLPLSKEAILSVENDEFQQFLLSLGIFRPSKQEMYWRFPATWNETDFRRRMNLLDLIMECTSFEECLKESTTLIDEITGHTSKPNFELPVEQPTLSLSEESEISANQHHLLSKKASKIIKQKNGKIKSFKVLQKRKKSKILLETNYDLDSEGEEIKVEEYSVHTKPSDNNYTDGNRELVALKSKKTRILESDSEDESLHIERKNPDNQLHLFSKVATKSNNRQSDIIGNMNGQQTKKKSRILSETEFDVDSEGEEIKTNEYLDETKPFDDDSPEIEVLKSKRTRILDSGSEDESLHIEKKKKHIISSDEDDD